MHRRMSALRNKGYRIFKRPRLLNTFLPSLCDDVTYALPLTSSETEHPRLTISAIHFISQIDSRKRKEHDRNPRIYAAVCFFKVPAVTSHSHVGRATCVFFYYHIVSHLYPFIIGLDLLRDRILTAGSVSQNILMMLEP